MNSWNGLLMDGGFNRTDINQHQHFVTEYNVNELFALYKVPREFDLLSIDVDYDDLYIWNAIDSSRYSPRVVMVEYNGFLNGTVNAVVDPNNQTRWGGTRYFGASLTALALMGRKKGYTLLCSDTAGVNLFFLRSDIAECQGIETYHPSLLWHPM